jgi:PhnB protein
MPAHTKQVMIPHLVVGNAAGAIDFYKKGFGFEEAMKLAAPSGQIIHAELKLGDDAVMFISDEFPNGPPGTNRSPKTLNGSCVTVHIVSSDVDAAFNRVIEAGATKVMPPTDMFWGDRFCKVIDPFGHHWSISQHKEDVPPEELKTRAKAMFANWAKR